MSQDRADSHRSLLARPTAIAIGAADLLAAGLLAAGVLALPARWWPVDSGAFVLTSIDLASGLGLLAGARWGLLVARVGGAIALAMGLFTVTLLAVTASWLSGIYGPVGRGGAFVLVFVAALVLPYFVVLPLVQLAWLRLDENAVARCSER